MIKHFCVKCAQCGDEWISSFISEHGLLVACDETGEACVDCGGEVEVVDEYEPDGEGCDDSDRDEVAFDEGDTL